MYRTGCRNISHCLACVARRFYRAGRTSGEAFNIQVAPAPISSRFLGVYYFARPTKTAMLRRLVIVNNVDSPILDYIHPDDHAQQNSINSVLVKVILNLFWLLQPKTAANCDTNLYRTVRSR